MGLIILYEEIQNIYSKESFIGSRCVVRDDCFGRNDVCGRGSGGTAEYHYYLSR